MKKFKQIISLLLGIFVIFFTINQYVFANSIAVSPENFIKMVEFSEDFEKWIELSESEKNGTIQPKIYNDLNTSFIASNPLYQVDLVGASLNSRYSLKDVIEKNVAIRNQYNTSNCWAFAGLSSLETNLALNNYNNGKNLSKIYDYSERHINYSTSRLFANDVINKFGFNRTPATGGQWYIFENYLSSGQGAINESDMPFEDNNNIIDISAIQNKQVQTRLYDTIYFKDYNNKNLSSQERTEQMNIIKQHIKNYGSVFASIHGDSSDASLFNCYNNATGAKYCNDSETHKTDHAVSIIGWDDGYEVKNFAENMKPTSPGAWIIRNSWGENIEYNLDQFKSDYFNLYTEQCKSVGWNKPEDIPNEVIEQAGYTISGNNILIPIGDKGYMYVSYEDCNIGKTLYGITKAIDTVDYDYIYQYNELYPAVQISLNTPTTYICNNFEKQSDNKEFLTGVALTAPETYTCKVYVNPNGIEKDKSNLQLVNLQAGESETIDTGYHTLEFAEPLEIKSNQFAVVVEIQGTRNQVDVLMEGRLEEYPLFSYVHTEKEKCFIASSGDLDNCLWFDLGNIASPTNKLTNGDSSLKAFTKEEVKEEEPDKIEEETKDDKKQDAKVQNTNFSNAKCSLNSIKAYYWTNGSSVDYTIVETEISGITRSLENDSYEYYYYLSPKSNLTNITDWVKIDEKQENKNKLVFKADSRDIPNIDEVSKSKTLFIYIKEVAKKGDNQGIVITKGIKYEQGSTEIETFVNGAKKEETTQKEVKEEKKEETKQQEIVVKDNNNDDSSKQTTDSTQTKQVIKGQTSDTTSPTKLPKTGSSLLIVLIIGITVVGLITFVKYIIISKDFK